MMYDFLKFKVIIEIWKKGFKSIAISSARAQLSPDESMMNTGSVHKVSGDAIHIAQLRYHY